MQATAALILAAGGATRFGSPKQLAELGGRPLIARTVAAAVAAGCEPIVVVAGDQAGAIQTALLETPARVVGHAAWQRGMGSSIRCGLAELPGSQPVILMACDQPLVNERSLTRLIQAAERAPDFIIAAAYAGTLGIPVVIPARHRALLDHVPDGQGAKGLLMAHADLVMTLPMPEAADDIDYPADLERVKQGME